MAKLKKREKMLLILAAGSALIFVLTQFVFSDKDEPPPTVASSKPVQTAKPEPEPEQVNVMTAGTKKESPEKQSTRKDITFTSWGRNPFAEANRLAVVDTARVDSTYPVLRGVIRKGDKAYALIGDEILQEGERSGDLKVLNIEEEQVVCRRGSKIITLYLGGNED